MFTKKSFFFLLAFLAVAIVVSLYFRIKTKPSESVLPVPTATPVQPNVDYLEVDPNPTYHACPGIWFNSEDVVYKGFNSTYEELETSPNPESGIFTKTWLVSLESIDINDRTITISNWSVVQNIPTGDGYFRQVQELTPQAWIDRAKELSLLAPDVTVHYQAIWGLDPDYDESEQVYAWAVTYSCSIVAK